MKSSTLHWFSVVVRALFPSRLAAVRAGGLFLSVAMLALTSCGGDSPTAPAEAVVAPPALNVTLASPSMQIDSLSGSTCTEGQHAIYEGGQIPVNTGVCAISQVDKTLGLGANTVQHVFVRDSTEVISRPHSSLSGGTNVVTSNVTPDKPGIWRVYLCTGTGTPTVANPCGSGTKMDSTLFRVYHVTPMPLTLTVDGPRSDTVRIKAVLDGVTLTKRICLNACNLSYDTVGTMVTLHAGPDAGDRFTGWSGDIVGTSPDTTVEMTDAMSVTAHFVKLPRTLTLTVSGPAGTVTDSSGSVDCAVGSTCSVKFDDGTVDTLRADISASALYSWSGCDTANGDTCIVTMDADKTVSATFRSGVPVTVTENGTGSGSVTSNPDGIDCPGTCKAYWVQGTTVTLTASAADGSVFAGWSGACTGTSTCTLTLGLVAPSVTATFTAVTHTLTVTKSGTGNGTVKSDKGAIDCPGTCSDDYAEGTAVTLTEKPATGSVFTGWSDACTGTATTCNVTMSADESVTATFAPAIVQHHLAVTLVGNGSVSSNPTGIDCGTTCGADFDEGTSVTLTAKADPGWTFTGWSGDACDGSTAATCDVTMDAAKSVTATFTATHTLTVTKSGAGSGTVSSDKGAIDCGGTCSDDYAEGTTVTLSASAGTNSTFNGWTGGGCSGTGTCVVTIGTSDVSVDALFKAKQTLNWTTAPPSTGQFGTTITVVATSTSDVTSTTTGLAPTYSVGATDQCSVDPTTREVTFNAGSGTCTVYADQAGDGDYNAASQISGVVTMVPQATSVVLSVTPGSQQYSDQVALEADVTPYEALTEQLTGQVDFYVESAAVSCASPAATAVGTVQVADADNGVASYTYAIDKAAGAYVVTACFTSSSAYFGNSGADDGSLTVSAENATVTEDNYPDYAVIGDAVTFNFDVSETNPETNADQSLVLPGDLNNATAEVVLSPVGGGGNVTVACTPGAVSGTGYGQVRPFQCSTSNLDVDAYEVTTSVTGGYYTGSDDATLTIYDPSLGFPSGGGTFVLDGEKVNFGFSFALQGNGKNATQRGHILVMRHRANGDVCRVKSNQLGPAAVNQANAVATFSGKANYVCTTPDGVTYDGAGNLDLYGWVQDNGQPGSSSSGTPDEFWVNVETTNSTLAMPTPAADNAQPLTGGDIQVPQSN